MITYTDYNTRTNDVQRERAMLIEMAVSMVKEHISSTEVLTGVRYSSARSLCSSIMFTIIVYLYKLANTVTVISPWSSAPG